MPRFAALRGNREGQSIEVAQGVSFAGGLGLPDGGVGECHDKLLEVVSHGLDDYALRPVSPEKNRNPCPPDFWTEKWTQKLWLPVDFRRLWQTVKN
jgi:hypothetical protein